MRRFKTLLVVFLQVNARFQISQDVHEKSIFKSTDSWVQDQLTKILEEKSDEINEELCVDNEIFEECSHLCEDDVLTCLSTCDSAICQNECFREFTECLDYCPCGVECPSGCEDCANPICPDLCEDAETQNEDYITCREDAIEKQTGCIRDCHPDHDCAAGCHETFFSAYDECPCVQRSTTTPATTTTQPPTDPSDVNILTMLYKLSDSFTISGDGQMKPAPTITAPTDGYVKYSTYAIVQGDFYVFGGDSYYNKISRLDGCEFHSIAPRLNYQYSYESAAISIENGAKALVCFSKTSSDGYNSCEIFNTTISIVAQSTQYYHRYGKLGYYEGKPTTVSGSDSNGYYKVETYNSSTGWSTITNHPRKIMYHTLTGLDDGSMILVGGYDYDEKIYEKTIWSLSKGQWSIIGHLNEHSNRGSSIKIGSYIYIFCGDYRDVTGGQPIERILIRDNELIETVVIGHHSYNTYNEIPVLYETHSSFCV